MTNRSQILESIRKAGVVGAGGAGFPTYRKLDAKVDCIIANGAECEPLLQKDRETMRRDSDDMLRGLQIMQQLTGATRVVIAVKRKNADVVQRMAAAVTELGFEIFVYEDVYPAGDELVLVYEITGKRIPPGGIPLKVGCLVDNVETIVNVVRAVDGAPVTEKYITICGAVHHPLTTRVPVGISMAECVQLAGGPSVDNPVALTGGVMMGGTTIDLSLSVTKVTGGIIVLPDNHYLFRRKSQSKPTYTRIGHGQCDQCSLCTELCPRYILGYPIQPHMVMRTLLMTGSDKDRNSLWSQYCCECNVCSLIACPEQLDPARICIDAKKRLKEKRLTRSEQELETLFRPVHPARKGREIPIQTLYQRLGLASYDRKADFVDTAPQPAHVNVPLTSHIGRPALPIVQVGDGVKKGDIIADLAKDELGCPAHASITGHVTAVTKESIQITAQSSGSAP
ncbi:MAG: 4Fe-4S dicluster domain-containing protein [Pirellulaceae bacterium]|nr:4Fe-4S dicluster domain-containing protein [Pirellulaceae bacterium]MDP6722667.1 4Fe-4S dicluster domain-containing protein [Pirellulaceae bacterium]